MAGILPRLVIDSKTRGGRSARCDGPPLGIFPRSGSISHRARWRCGLKSQNLPKWASPFPRESLDSLAGVAGTHSIRNVSPSHQRTATCCPYKLALWSWTSRYLLPKTVRRDSKPWLLPLGSLVQAQTRPKSLRHLVPTWLACLVRHGQDSHRVPRWRGDGAVHPRLG